MSEFIETRIAEHIGPDLQGKAYRPLPAVSQIARANSPRQAVAPRLPTPPQRAPEPATQPRLAGTQRASEPRLPQRPVREAEAPAAVLPAEPIRPAAPPRVVEAPPRVVEVPRPVETLRPAATARPVEAPRPIETLRPAPTSRTVEAARPIRVAQPPTTMGSSVGRPAPTPAAQDLKVYRNDEESRDTTDYRAIRF
ncbi:MAG TPA: hypothetical protein VH877_16960 [Polyangia bacterium]|nr:hypothetical protein [Polyangia bacterium]